MFYSVFTFFRKFCCHVLLGCSGIWDPCGVGSLCLWQLVRLKLKLGLQRRAREIPLGELNVIELENLEKGERRIWVSSQIGMNDWHRRYCLKQK